MDPVWSMTFSLMLSMLFMFTAWHKLSNPLEFSAVLATYQIVPVGWCYYLGIVIGLLEALTALLVLIHFNLGYWLLLGLLSSYSLSIGINLLRGRVHIDCGCGGAPIHLTGWLLVRNACLIGMGVIAMWPSSDRPLRFFDMLNIGFAALSLLLLYACANQLLANRSYWHTNTGVNG